MKQLSDTEIVFVKHPGISYVSISELSMWVTDEDRAIARKAEEEMLKRVVEKFNRDVMPYTNLHSLTDKLREFRQELKKQAGK